MTSAVAATLGMVAATILAPTAAADPAPPSPAPEPAAESATLAAAPSDQAPAGVPHLSSPDNLPPGTTIDPATQEGRGVGYLRDLWHAVQTQEISGAGALLLLTQRPMNADAAPPPGMSAGPQPAPPAPVTEPVPAPETEPAPAE